MRPNPAISHAVLRDSSLTRSRSYLLDPIYIYIHIYTQKRHLPLSTCQIYKTRTYTIHFFTVTRLFMYAKLSIIIGTPPRTRSITVLWKISRALRIYREHFIARIFVITSWMKFIFQSRLFNNT